MRASEAGGAILGAVTNATITIRDTDSIIDFTTNALTFSETTITNGRGSNGLPGIVEKNPASMGIHSWLDGMVSA